MPRGAGRARGRDALLLLLATPVPPPLPAPAAIAPRTAALRSAAPRTAALRSAATRISCCASCVRGTVLVLAPAVSREGPDEWPAPPGPSERLGPASLRGPALLGPAAFAPSRISRSRGPAAAGPAPQERSCSRCRSQWRRSSALALDKSSKRCAAAASCALAGAPRPGSGTCGHAAGILPWLPP